MPNYAHITIIGHLGRDPEQRFIESGDSVVSFVSFSVATTKKRKNEDTTTWWRCTMFGKRGEIITKYLAKGDPILCSGEPCMREYQAQDGSTKVSLEIDVKDFTFIGKKDGAQQPQQQHSAPSQKPTQEQPQTAQMPFDDEIPF